MAPTRRIRRSRTRSTIKTRRTRVSDSSPPAPVYPNYDRALIVEPTVHHSSIYKPILVPRPTMLQFAPYEEDRSPRTFFIIMVYGITLIVLMLAILQWELVSLYAPVRDFFRAEYWINIICVSIAMILLSIFMLIREARYMPIFNWVLFIFIIELTVIGICAFAAFWEPMTMLGYFLFSMLLIILCLVIGTFIPCDLTANVAAIFLISIILFIIAQLMIVLHVINTMWNGFFFAFSLLNISIVLVFVMYHAQLIRGSRYAEISATDGLFAVVVLFFYFCLIFMLFAYGVWPHFNQKGKFHHSGRRDSVEDLIKHMSRINYESYGSNIYKSNRHGGIAGGGRSDYGGNGGTVKGGGS